MVESARVFKIEQDGDTLFVMPLGHSLQYATGEVEKQSKDLVDSLDERGVKNVVIDFTKVNMLDSIVIGALFALASKTRKGNGRTLMCNLSERMQEALAVVKLDQMVTQCADREAAKAILRSAGE